MVGSFWNELLLSQYKLINVVYLFHNLKLVCIYEVFVILFSQMCAFLAYSNSFFIYVYSIFSCVTWHKILQIFLKWRRSKQK